jgi:hypothetical protein
MTEGNFAARPRSKIFDFPIDRKFCSLCGLRAAILDIYARRLGICADCLNKQIWNAEKKAFARFIRAKEGFGLKR